MKKTLVLVLFCAAAAHAQQKKGFVLNGEITGSRNTKIYLGHSENKKNVQDSTITKDGKFTFKGTRPGELYYISVAGKRLSYSFFADAGTLTFKTDSAFTNPELRGSRYQPAWKEWVNSWNTITPKAGGYYKRLDAAHKAKDSATIREVQQLFDDLQAEMDTAIYRLVRKYASSPVAPWLIIDRYINYPAPPKVAALLPLLTGEARSSVYGQEIITMQKIAAKTAIGASPAFELADTTGQLIKLSAYRGKYVLVDFWASWCAPCRKENPNVLAAYQKYHSKGFEVLGVTLDTKKEAWLAAIKKDGLAWGHVGDLKGWESGIVKEYGIRAIPTNFLLDPSGKVIAKDLREDALQQKLAELFK